MRAVLEACRAWRAAGAAVALARVVAVAGSSPRAPGAAMAVRADGRIVGSLSGGCVESAVVEEALAVCADGVARQRRFGYSDDEALAVGLTCGGTLEVLIEPFTWPDALSGALLAALRCGASAGVASVVGGAGDEVRAGAVLVLADGTVSGGVGSAELDRIVGRDLVAVADAGSGGVVRHYGRAGEALRADVAVFLQGFAPARRLIVCGAMDFSAALVSQAKLLGYRVSVCDARAPFATPARFPDADEVVCDWPDRYIAERGGELGARDGLCVLTHDPKFDVPALLAALATPVGYLGAMGSRRTVADRRRRLVAAGVDEAALARIRMPIGLDLGARTPAETAVSICAEMILAERAGAGVPLSSGSGPIHGGA